MSETIPTPRRPIRNLRWWICGLLFLSTVINYIDRQTLSVLIPYLKEDYKWTDSDYALILISFRIFYALGQISLGRFIDKVGTRLGLTITVAFYSLVAMLTSVGSFFKSPLGVLRSFVVFRSLLGLGEAPNWPAATKAVSEWFPRKERGWAVALFDSGSSLGAAVAPMLVIWMYLGMGRRWWPAFVIVGALGFFWLILWRALYHPPESHPRISAEELEMIVADKRESALEEADSAGQPPTRWIELLKLPQTWGIIAARGLTDPVWYFIADWFMLFLVQEKHFDPKSALVVIWIPFVAVDAGNFFSGGFSSWLISRGWSVEWARKVVVIFGALGVAGLIPAIYATSLFAVAAWFAVATFSYCCFATMALVLPSDLFQSKSVASVSGISGCAAGVITVLSTFSIGDVATKYGFPPILIAGSIIPLIGAVLVLWLIRNPRTEMERRILRRI